MKFEKLTRALLPAGFAFGLFASQQAFVLATPDHGIVGQGTFEETADAVAQMKIRAQGREYNGTGIVRQSNGSSTPNGQRQGIRSDRAFIELLGKRYQKHAHVFMESPDGAKLACELMIDGGEFSGKCINPDTQETLMIKTSPGEHP